MKKLTSSGTRAANTPSAQLAKSALFYRGKKQRQFASPIGVKLEGETLKLARELKADLQKQFGLKAWQAESAVLHCALITALGVNNRIAYQL